MNKYYLILLPDGGIEIRDSNFKIVLHKSYNLGERLQDNLILMYKEWEKLND